MMDQKVIILQMKTMVLLKMVMILKIAKLLVIKILMELTIIVKHAIYLSNPRANISISNQIVIKKFDKCKHIKLTIENIDINDVDKASLLIHYRTLKKNMINTS